MELRAPERFVDVDVPEPGHCPLVEQRCLERSAPSMQPFREPLRREGPPERLLSEAALQIVICLFGLEELPGAEPAHVAVGDVGSVVQRHDRTPVGVVWQRAAVRMTQAAGHPQVNQQHALRLEAHDQVLPATFERDDPLPLELGCHRQGLERTHEPRVVDVDALEAATDDVRLEREPNRLDLRKLGHQLIVSSTIGRSAGALSPIAYAASTSSQARAAAVSSCACTSASDSSAATASPRFLTQM